MPAAGARVFWGEPDWRVGFSLCLRGEHPGKEEKALGCPAALVPAAVRPSQEEQSRWVHVLFPEFPVSSLCVCYVLVLNGKEPFPVLLFGVSPLLSSSCCTVTAPAQVPLSVVSY